MIITAGATNKSLYFYIVGDASHASPGDPVTGLLFSDIETGGSASYNRQGAARVDLTLITQTVAGAHSDGGFVEVDATNQPGVYRCDYPDAAFATGVDFVVCQIVVAAANNAIAAPILIDIVDVNLRDSVRAGLTALPNAAADAAGGLIISDAGGLAADVMAASVTAIEEDTGTTLDTHMTDLKGTSFVKATHSNVAIIDRGNTAWTGGATTTDSGTAQAGSSTTMTHQAGASAIDNTYQGQVIGITGGTGVGQSKAIASYVGATKVSTIIGTWATTPDATSVYEVYPADIDEIIAAPTVDAIADGVWNENTTGHTAAGSFGEQCKNDIDAILSDSGELQTDLANGGRLDLLIDAIKVGTDNIGTAGAGLTDITLNAASIDLIWDELMAGHITADSAGLVLNEWQDGGRLDLLLDAIPTTAMRGTDNAALASVCTEARLAKLASMTFTKALELDVNVQSINGAAVVGDGNATPWDGI